MRWIVGSGPCLSNEAVAMVWKAKFWIYWTIDIQILTYGHEVCMTDKQYAYKKTNNNNQSLMQVVEMRSF